MNHGVATGGDVAELRAGIGAVKAESWAVERVTGFALAIVPAAVGRPFGVLQGSRPGVRIDFPPVVSHIRSAGRVAEPVCAAASIMAAGAEKSAP